MNSEFLHTIPGYELLSHLNQGGMADVYLAIQNCFGRKVALKILPSSNDNEEFRRRFLQEARIVAQLSHSNIIGVHDVGEITGSYYIAMDFLPGKNLKDLINDGLTPKAAIQIIKQIALALDFAHHKGFVHRDVKPDNVLFREDGNAVLTDFGIASDSRNDVTLTQTGLVYGTPNFMSPEQAFGQPTDSRSDIYSLGVMFHQMLTHRLPYRASDPIEMAMKHQNDPLPILPLDLSVLQPIMDKLLAKLPEDRYQLASEFIDDLMELSTWELEELDAFDAAEHNAYLDHERDESEYNEHENDIDSSEKLGGYSSNTLNTRKHRSINPFSQGDVAGLLIKCLFLVTASVVLLAIFSPDVLSSLPYYEQIRTSFETLIASNDS